MNERRYCGSGAEFIANRTAEHGDFHDLTRVCLLSEIHAEVLRSVRRPDNNLEGPFGHQRLLDESLRAEQGNFTHHFDRCLRLLPDVGSGAAVLQAQIEWPVCAVGNC